MDDLLSLENLGVRLMMGCLGLAGRTGWGWGEMESLGRVTVMNS